MLARRKGKVKDLDNGTNARPSDLTSFRLSLLRANTFSPAFKNHMDWLCPTLTVSELKP